MTGPERFEDLSHSVYPRPVPWPVPEGEPGRRERRRARAVELAAQIGALSPEVRRHRRARPPFRCASGRAVVTVYRIPGDDGGLLAVPTGARVFEDGRWRSASAWWLDEDAPGALHCRCCNSPILLAYR